jgi:hypothetical protein
MLPVSRFAKMVELVDTLVSEASAERLGGSSPPLRTTLIHAAVT